MVMVVDVHSEGDGEDTLDEAGDEDEVLLAWNTETTVYNVPEVTAFKIIDVSILN